jgi:hypothetical protein
MIQTAFLIVACFGVFALWWGALQLGRIADNLKK